MTITSLETVERFVVLQKLKKQKPNFPLLLLIETQDIETEFSFASVDGRKLKWKSKNVFSC